MIRRMPMMVTAMATVVVLAACGSPQAPAATSAPALPQATTAPALSATDVIAPTDSAPATSAPAVPQATEAPAGAPAENVSAAKPVFIDFYAPW